MTLARILVGVAVLLLGRRLFWLFVGAMGFIVAISLAGEWIRGQPDWLILILGLVVGVIGAVLATFLQRLAVGLAGFLAGAYLTQSLLQLLNWQIGSLNWLFILLGGILGAVLVGVLFDWALIVLSSLAGASLLAQTIEVRPVVTGLLFFGALIVGLAVQASQLRGRTRAQEARFE